jgi:hypothetical protein
VAEHRVVGRDASQDVLDAFAHRGACVLGVGRSGAAHGCQQLLDGERLVRVGQQQGE